MGALVGGVAAEEQRIVLLLGPEGPFAGPQRIVHPADPVETRRQFTLPVADRDEAGVFVEGTVVLPHIVVDRSVHGDRGRNAQRLVGGGVQRAGESMVVDDVDMPGAGQFLHHAPHLERVDHFREGVAQPLGLRTLPDRDEFGLGTGLSGAQ